MEIKHASQCEDKEQKEVKSQGSGRFWMYTHTVIDKQLVKDKKI